MSDNFNLDIMQNDGELEKLCTNSVELINYARNIVLWKRNKWKKSEQNMEAKLLKHYQKSFRKSLVKDFQKIL